MRHALKSALRVLGGIVVDVRCKLVDSESQAADFIHAPNGAVGPRVYIGTDKRLCVTVMGKCLDILRLPLEHVSSLAILYLSPLLDYHKSIATMSHAGGTIKKALGIVAMLDQEKPHTSITDWIEVLTSDRYEELSLDGIPELVESVNIQGHSGTGVRPSTSLHERADG
jgi:hypothetical protein